MWNLDHGNFDTLIPMRSLHSLRALVSADLFCCSKSFTSVNPGAIGGRISLADGYYLQQASRAALLMPINQIARKTQPLQAISTPLLALHADPSYCLSFLIFLAGIGISLERNTVVGKALSAPLATMAAALTVANLGGLPFSSPVYTAITSFAVPLAVPLLLCDSDLKRVLSDTGSLLAAFAVGAVATVVGTLAAVAVLPSTPINCACALAARHIGGAINFVAVAETLRIPSATVSAAIAADNVVVALYFALLFSIAKEENAEDSVSDVVVPEPSSTISLATISSALSTAAALVTSGRILTRSLLPARTSSLPVTSVLTVLAATIFTEHFSSLQETGSVLGVWLIQLFFAASGAAGSIGLVMTTAPLLFVFSGVQILVHFGVLMSIGRWIFRLQRNELYLASNANVGGPTTAAAMAQAKGWKKLVLPALMIGIMGYACATPIALALEPVLRWVAGR